ncbi:MAG: outer membrane protein assembly factor BamA [Lentisphaerae bacterium]|nr:outer membrane protein assembly factor BamA [Lentisphaerota bacterium]
MKWLPAGRPALSGRFLFKRRAPSRCPLVGYLLLATLFFLPLTAAVAAHIREVKVISRTRALADEAFVFGYISVQAGAEVDQRRISRDVRTLLDTGRFSFVDSELTPVADKPDTFDLTYVVEQRARLEKPVSVIGAEAMGEKKIRQWLDLAVGDFVDDAVMSVQARKVLAEYHQRYYHDANLKWALSLNETNGFAQVTVTLKEGPRASLRKVAFTGNTYQPPSAWRRFKAGLKHQRAVAEHSVPPEELAAALQPRLWNIFSFFTKRGVYNPDELETDCEVLRALYQNRGYLDARIGAPQVRAYERGKLEAVFPIEEGEQYRLGTISLQGVSLFAASNLWAVVPLKTGAVASLGLINKTAAELRDYYQSRGYMRAQAKPGLQPQLTGAVVNVQFDISEGSLVYTRYIDIRGNTRTKDKVIRRELLVRPGELYDHTRIRRSENILRNLGFFESVHTSARETLDPARDDLVFEVEEKRTGQFTVGAGYSSVDELVGFIELSQGNFDLLEWPSFTGAGQKLRLRTQVGSQRQDYEISFVEPWFLDRKLSLGVDLYDRTRENLSKYYNEERLGTALTLGKPLKGFFFQRANLQYRLEKITIYDVATNAAPIFQNDAGDWNDSSLTLTFIHDTRDNVFVPTRGAKLSLSGRLSGGPLGFDVNVYGFEADSTVYFPVIFDHVLSLRGWAETVEEYGGDEDVHVFDRLFLGGPRTLRGFKYRYVAPYDQDQPIGGKSGALASAEYTVPLYKNILRWAMFYDLGNVWLDAFDFDLLEYNSDAGIGLRLDIPGFPIRLDYAWPLEISGDDIQRTSARFNFWLGYGF